MTYDQIRSLIYFRTKTNSTSLPNTSLNLYTQPAEDRIAQLILKTDSKWQPDDANRTTLPIGTQNLVSGQQDYSLPTTILTLDRIELKDSGGNWHRLSPIDQQLKKRGQNIALSAYQTTNGLPTEYDIIGNSVILYPTPNYSQSASLKFFYSRIPLKYDYTANTNAGQFTDGSGSGATTDTPGFNQLFHPLIGLISAFQYATDNGLEGIAALLREKEAMEKDMIEFYAQRNRDYRPRFTISSDSNK